MNCFLVVFHFLSFSNFFQEESYSTNQKQWPFLILKIDFFSGNIASSWSPLLLDSLLSPIHTFLSSLIREQQSGIQEVKTDKQTRMGQNKCEMRAREKYENHLQMHRHTHPHIRISMKAQNQKLLYITYIICKYIYI